MSKEILVYAGAIAHEKHLSLEDVLIALEKGIVTSFAKKHGLVHVNIDREHGTIHIQAEDGRDMSDEWGRQDASRVKQVWARCWLSYKKKQKKRISKKPKNSAFFINDANLMTRGAS